MSWSFFLPVKDKNQTCISSCIFKVTYLNKQFVNWLKTWTADDTVIVAKTRILTRILSLITLISPHLTSTRLLIFCCKLFLNYFKNNIFPKHYKKILLTKFGFCFKIVNELNSKPNDVIQEKKACLSPKELRSQVS